MKDTQNESIKWLVLKVEEVRGEVLYRGPRADGLVPFDTAVMTGTYKSSSVRGLTVTELFT